MTVRIQDFESTRNAKDVNELERALRSRHGDANSFWLSHGEETKPALSILVRGDLAYLHYFPNDSHPGFASIGTVRELKPDHTTTFFLDTPDQEQEIMNNSIVSFSEAVQAAKAFFISKDLPAAIRWVEL
jgi:hypothetical protein